MLFDITQKVYKKGDKFNILHNGLEFEVECIETTVVEFERQYRIRFADGSERYMTASELLKQPN